MQYHICVNCLSSFSVESLFFLAHLLNCWNCKTRCWFQTFFMFIPTWGNDPIWLIFFRRGWFNHQPEKQMRKNDNISAEQKFLQKKSGPPFQGRRLGRVDPQTLSPCFRALSLLQVIHKNIRNLNKLQQNFSIKDAMVWGNLRFWKNWWKQAPKSKHRYPKMMLWIIYCSSTCTILDECGSTYQDWMNAISCQDF